MGIRKEKSELIFLFILLLTVRLNAGYSLTFTGALTAEIRLYSSSVLTERSAASGQYAVSDKSGIYTMWAFAEGKNPVWKCFYCESNQTEEISFSNAALPPIYKNWISYYGSLEVDHDGDGICEPAETGEIVSFHTSSGILCGSGTVRESGKYGFISVYQDDPDSAVKDGYSAGEKLTVAVNGMKTGVTVTAGSEPISRLDISQNNAGRIGMYQINLFQGWNLISFRADPLTCSLDKLLHSFRDSVTYVTGFYRKPDSEPEGFRTFINKPDLVQFSTLSFVDRFHGYWFYLEKDDQLLYSGIVEKDLTREVSTGWNLLGYWKSDTGELPAASGEGGIISSFTGISASVKALFIMGFYRNSQPEGFRTFLGNEFHIFSTLLQLNPEHGYWYYMSDSTEFYYTNAPERIKYQKSSDIPCRYKMGNGAKYRITGGKKHDRFDLRQSSATGN